MEVVDDEQAGKIKYRYHFMDGSQKVLFRYDNSPHHKGIVSFPHHQHKADGILPSQESDLRAILYEISEIVKS